ncbi:MAG: SPOR domain-containing protein [Candidatus Schekmanbacteria bacterium]|nr:SPOR domain-containing protein [Candidatus Schekmanbacteria bacterium]
MDQHNPFYRAALLVGCVSCLVLAALLGFQIGRLPLASTRTAGAVAPPTRPAVTAVPTVVTRAASALPPATTAASGTPADAARQAPPSQDGLVLQVYSLSRRDAAERSADELRRAGFPAYVQDAHTGDGKPSFRVRIGPLATQADAAQATAQLIARGFGQPWIVKE